MNDSVDTIKVSITEDELEARISITAGVGSFPTLDEIIIAVRQAGVVYGINEALLERMAREKRPVEAELIAVGVPAEPGPDAQLRWHVNVSSSLAPSQAAGNRVDFKKIQLFETVSENQLLVEKIPARRGLEGKTVTGKKIAAFGVDCQLPVGRNVRLSEDGLSVLATQNGSVFYDGSHLNVEKIYEVKGDVGYATGNIKFSGPVVIHGDVRSGFRVEARDSIVIAGNVEAASVYSQNGDITIHCGVVGKNRAKILAGGNLVCGFIQEATIGVRKDVIVSHYIINSDVSAGRHVLLEKNEGLIRGGCVTAESGIKAISIGSVKNVHTELKIRNHGENESHNQLWELSRKRADLGLRMGALEKRLSFLAILEKRMNFLSEPKRLEKKQVEIEIKRLKSKIQDIDKQELMLQKETSRLNINREIQVSGALFPNVSIDINGTGFYTDNQLNAVKIFKFKDEIIVESLLGINNLKYDIFIPE